jgi:hypothetical protein
MRLGPATSSLPLLPLQERVLDPEHPDTMTIRASLAEWTEEAGMDAALKTS